jgi:hypothetical protein
MLYIHKEEPAQYKKVCMQGAVKCLMTTCLWASRRRRNHAL